MVAFTAIRPGRNRRFPLREYSKADKTMNYDSYIRQAYRDLQEPDYGFVREALDAGRYDDIRPGLTTVGFSVVDDTEPNTDVCRTLIVGKDDFQAAVKLSFAGPFAAVFRLQGTNEHLQRIISLLADRGMSVLTDDVLSQAYEISLLDLDEPPTVYNALFSTDPMPS
ncbi:hypothetical protein SAMN03159496_00197 [Rhizobium sp. NFR07]|nr:hypothetical protein SAMN03159496_00197 [Rhizobium sp. NFR07]